MVYYFLGRSTGSLATSLALLILLPTWTQYIQVKCICDVFLGYNIFKYNEFVFGHNAFRSSYIQIQMTIDDSSETGELQTKSALNLIVFGPKLEHLDLIE